MRNTVHSSTKKRKKFPNPNCELAEINASTSRRSLDVISEQLLATPLRCVQTRKISRVFINFSKYDVLTFRSKSPEKVTY